MTVSGINTFNLSRNELIYLAMEEIGVKTFNRTPTAAEVQQASVRLNAMIKHWKTKGINLWTSKQGTLFIQPGQSSYALDGLTSQATESFTYSQVTSDAVSGSNTLIVNDPTQFTIGFNIVINQSNNTNLFTTVTNKVGSILTLADALTADVSEGAYVYCYQTKIKRPEGISAATYVLDSNSQIPLVINSNNTYFTIPAINTEGIVNTLYYNKQLNSGIIYLWPIPNVNTYYVTFTFQKMYDDLTLPSTTPDFPQEWLRAIYLNLAVDLMRPFGKKAEDYPDLIMAASQALQDCEGYDQEDTSIYIQPASMDNIYTYR